MGCIKLMLCLYLYCLYTVSAQEPDVESDIDDNNIIQDTSQRIQHTNHKPMFKDCARYNPEVKEEELPDAFLIKVKAVDEDPEDEEGGRITYRIEEQEGKRKNFRIDKKRGEIFTTLPFDRDEPMRQRELYLTVSASDDGWPQLADICTFKVSITDINDNVPSFDKLLYNTSVSEDHPKNTEVARVFAYDIDEGENGRLTYSFTDTTTGQLEEFFRIEPDTGVIYLKKSLKGQRGAKYSTGILVQDNGMERKSATAEIFFTVVDSRKKAPTVKVGKFQKRIRLREDEHDYKKILVNITAESNINDQDIIFELVKGKTTQTNKDQTFVLNPTGTTSATILLARQLDYETVTEYKLTIRAQNKASLFATVDVIVEIEDVNDEIPYFIEILKGSIVENDKADATAMTVRAIDKDGTSPNNLVEYELLSHTELFSIDSTSGEIKGKKSFDRELEKIYHVLVQARDSSPSALFPSKNKPNSANQTFSISIEDQNDNAPKFEQAIYRVYNISKTADIQKDVVEVTAKDSDTASVIKYSIIEGNIDDAFNIEGVTGRIKVNRKLDFEKIESYNLIVRAYDGVYHDETKVIIHK